MEDNRKFATFFADAPKGKKIGAVLSWIATVILLVALFVPGYQLRYQMKTEKGTFKDIPATMTSELKQMKEAAKLNFQFGAGTTSDKIDEFVEKGSTSVFSYLVSPDLQKARLVNRSRRKFMSRLPTTRRRCVRLRSRICQSRSAWPHSSIRKNAGWHIWS